MHCVSQALQQLCSSAAAYLAACVAVNLPGKQDPQQRDAMLRWAEVHVAALQQVQLVVQVRHLHISSGGVHR